MLLNQRCTEVGILWIQYYFEHFLLNSNEKTMLAKKRPCYFNVQTWLLIHPLIFKTSRRTTASAESDKHRVRKSTPSCRPTTWPWTSTTGASRPKTLQSLVSTMSGATWPPETTWDQYYKPKFSHIHLP